MLIMIMDPDIGGFVLCRRIIRAHTGPRLVISNGFSTADRVHEVRQTGAVTPPCYGDGRRNEKCLDDATISQPVVCQSTDVMRKKEENQLIGFVKSLVI